MSGFDIYSAAARPVYLKYMGDNITHATAFFWELDGRIFLVSNWHVFSGREPARGQSKDPEARCPDTLLVNMIDMKSPGFKQPGEFTILLEDGEPEWLEHPKFGRNIDVAVLDVTDKLPRRRGSESAGSGSVFRYSEEKVSPVCINKIDSSKEIKTGVGSDVFIIGFPLNPAKTSELPIWKRASIATEFEYQIDGKDCFLVDTATRPGMSGSPVILRMPDMRFMDINQSTTTIYKTRTLGIYSGRQPTKNLNEAQLGIVWKKSLIEEIIRGGVRGNCELPD